MIEKYYGIELNQLCPRMRLFANCFYTNFSPHTSIQSFEGEALAQRFVVFRHFESFKHGAIFGLFTQLSFVTYNVGFEDILAEISTW